jgi:methionyl aminopeptidase
MIRDAGAESCYIDYHPSFGGSPFGKVICTSINDAVLHGLPHDYDIADGDIVSIDFAASIDGWVCDSAISFVTGTADPEVPVILVNEDSGETATVLSKPDGSFEIASAADSEPRISRYRDTLYPPEAASSEGDPGFAPGGPPLDGAPFNPFQTQPPR